MRGTSLNRFEIRFLLRIRAQPRRGAVCLLCVFHKPLSCSNVAYSPSSFRLSYVYVGRRPGHTTLQPDTDTRYSSTAQSSSAVVRHLRSCFSFLFFSGLHSFSVPEWRPPFRRQEVCSEFSNFRHGVHVRFFATVASARTDTHRSNTFSSTTPSRASSRATTSTMSRNGTLRKALPLCAIASGMLFLCIVGVMNKPHQNIFGQHKSSDFPAPAASLGDVGQLQKNQQYEEILNQDTRSTFAGASGLRSGGREEDLSRRQLWVSGPAEGLLLAVANSDEDADAEFDSGDNKSHKGHRNDREHHKDLLPLDRYEKLIVPNRFSRTVDAWRFLLL